MTHYLPAFVVVNGRLQQAACGALIEAHEHSTEPTCPGCQDYLSAEADTLTEVLAREHQQEQSCR